MARTGRRPGASGTRDRILAAARVAFAEAGFDGATIRGIARTAAVDPALVHHYFGTKEQLFVAGMQLPFDPATLVDAITRGGLEQAGERTARFAVGVWVDPGATPILLGVVRSAVSDERAAATLRDLMERTLLPAARGLGVDQPELRASLAWSQIVGLFFGRYILRVGPLVTISSDQLIAALAPQLQQAFTGPIPGGRRGTVAGSAGS
jgi:AcrR family transcriptional regulator